MDRLLDTGRNFRERELDIHANVGTGPRAGTLTAAGAPKQIAESAKAPEIAHEDIERFGKVYMVESAGTAAQSCFAVAIVCGAFVGITKHIVRFRDLLEFFFRFARTVVPVGMISHRKFAIRLLYLIIARVPAYLKHFVEISHFS